MSRRTRFSSQKFAKAAMSQVYPPIKKQTPTDILKIFFVFALFKLKIPSKRTRHFGSATPYRCLGFKKEKEKKGELLTEGEKFHFGPFDFKFNLIVFFRHLQSLAVFYVHNGILLRTSPPQLI